MESANGITRQQAEDEMQLFKKVFTVVRLLDGEHLEQMHKRCKLDCKDEKEKSECYEIWIKDHPCEKLHFPAGIVFSGHRRPSLNLSRRALSGHFQIHKSRRKRLRDGACQIHGHGYAGGFPWL